MHTHTNYTLAMVARGGWIKDEIHTAYRGLFRALFSLLRFYVYIFACSSLAKVATGAFLIYPPDHALLIKRKEKLAKQLLRILLRHHIKNVRVYTLAESFARAVSFSLSTVHRAFSPSVLMGKSESHRETLPLDIVTSRAQQQQQRLLIEMHACDCHVCVCVWTQEIQWAKIFHRAREKFLPAFRPYKVNIRGGL